MAANIDEGSEREINVDVNIVPFIDLMSVCIIFLLITAVWTQVSMIQLGTSIYGKKNETGQVDQPLRADIFLKILVKEDGYHVLLGRDRHKLPKLTEEEYDKLGLVKYLKGVKERYPKKSDAIINLSNRLTYEHLIVSMDAILNAGFPEVSIETGEVP